MTIRDQVFTVLKKKPGIPHSIKGVADALPDCSYEQVANSLADLALFDERIERTARGVYVYEEPDVQTPKIKKLLEKPTPFAGSVSDSIKDDEVAHDKFFTQVGTAQNGDLLITRDSDGVAYRATPL